MNEERSEIHDELRRDEETAISSDSGVFADRLILGAGETAAVKNKGVTKS